MACKPPTFIEDGAVGRVQLLMYVCAIMRQVPVQEIQNLAQVQSFGCVSHRKIGGEIANCKVLRIDL